MFLNKIQPTHSINDSSELALKVLKVIPEEKGPIQDLINRHIISISSLSRRSLLQLFRLAAKFESNLYPHQNYSLSLKGKILISVFHEPSTRTRLSFDSAWHRLGGNTLDITDINSTGTAKGESLEDIASMFNNYGDCVVLRDSDFNAITKMTKTLQIPIINAGNGLDEHPSQAMADLYTIFKWKPLLTDPNIKPKERVVIGVIGIPSRMRTIRSLLRILSKFPELVKEIVIISTEDVINDGTLFSCGQMEELKHSGLNIRISSNLIFELPKLDIIYLNAKVWTANECEVHGKEFQLTNKLPFKPGAIIMHPLARGPELSTCLDNTVHNWYYKQARGAVFIRMALFTCLMNRID